MENGISLINNFLSCWKEVVLNNSGPQVFQNQKNQRSCFCAFFPDMSKTEERQTQFPWFKLRLLPEISGTNLAFLCALGWPTFWRMQVYLTYSLQKQPQLSFEAPFLDFVWNAVSTTHRVIGFFFKASFLFPFFSFLPSFLSLSLFPYFISSTVKSSHSEADKVATLSLP